MMKAILPLVAAAALFATPLFAGGDSFSEGSAHPAPPRDVGIYERIAAHYGPMGRDVKEEFRDGPCEIEREWEKNGDYTEHISCRGPSKD
jgi:hypothetical protein